MRRPADAARVHRLLEDLGRYAQGPGRVYLTGVATALLEGWRASTVDVDLKLDPEPTADALLVSIASQRLRELDLPVAPAANLAVEPELALYELLGSLVSDPYYAYRAALAELDSFMASLEARR